MEKRPSFLIKHAHPIVCDYILTLEKRLEGIAHEKLTIKIAALEQEIKDLKTRNLRLKYINDCLQRDKTLDQIVQCSSNEEKHIGLRKKLSALDLSDNEQSSDSDDSDYPSDDEDAGNSIIIKNVKKCYLDEGLERFIQDIARVMHVKLLLDNFDGDGGSHLKAVNEMKRKLQTKESINTVILLVCFNKRDVKINFLQYKEKLKKHPIYCGLEVEDYVSDRTFQLYRYAKKLKNYNYFAVYWRNNRVFAQKMKNDVSIEIRSRSQVNNLKRNS